MSDSLILYHVDTTIQLNRNAIIISLRNHDTGLGHENTFTS